MDRGDKAIHVKWRRFRLTVRRCCHRRSFPKPDTLEHNGNPEAFTSPPSALIAPCAWKATHLYEMVHFQHTQSSSCELIPSSRLTFLVSATP
jgi:hypothetical protein